MPCTDFPLRWETTGDQWWYASPIDWAAANGHYDLVRELIRVDGNHLIQLTSLRRIRRLESVWDDDEHFADVAKNRSEVAKKLFSECETKGIRNSLIRGGYGGWLLYTTASAGDLVFVKELLDKDPLLVFGEGEFGVTDVLYAAARSKSCEVFRLLLDFAISPRITFGIRKEVGEHIGVIPSAYKWEMMNRAVHAAARGGNLMILKELLSDCYDVSTYKDTLDSTIFHAAAGRGQVEVVRYLAASYDITNSSDNQGNTALHVAAYRGQLTVVEVLLFVSPSIMHSKNNNGETFLHMTISGFQTPTFRRVDHQVEFMKQLVHGKVFNVEDIINDKNNEGRTALHLAIIGNIDTDVVELLMTVSSIDVNIRDNNSMTPLDLLKQRPTSASSEILTRQLISARGVSSCQDYSARRLIASHLRMGGITSSPGTSFRIPDSEIFLHLGIEKGSEISSSSRLSTDSAEWTKHYSNMKIHSPKGNKKQGSVNDAAERLKSLRFWPTKKKPESLQRILDRISMSNSAEIPLSLRNRYSKESMPSSLPNNKRTLSVRSDIPSPTSKKKFASGLLHGVLQAIPYFNATRSHSRSLLKSPVSSHHSLDNKQKSIYIENDMAGPSHSSAVDDGAPNMHEKAAFVNKRLIKHICFGPSSSQKQRKLYDQSIPPIA